MCVHHAMSKGHLRERPQHRGKHVICGSRAQESKIDCSLLVSRTQTADATVTHRVRRLQVDRALVTHLAAKERCRRPWVPRSRNDPLLHESPSLLDNQRGHRLVEVGLQLILHIPQVRRVADTDDRIAT
eukprot:2374624-Pleurochrysis_carterae.AAC.1